MPTVLGLSPSFGFGDRIGLATPGHVAAMTRCGGEIQPIFAQQSIREMARTDRRPVDVMRDATDAANAAGWTGRSGADADHLKTIEDAKITADAGFTFFTIDPSGNVDPQADHYDEATLRARFDAIADQIDWIKTYRGKTISLDSGDSIEFSEAACMKAAVKYGSAISQTVALAGEIDALHRAKGCDYEIELSVDETEQPTTFQEHYIIADQVLRHGVKLISLAPRFIGEFEKGVDYKGDLGQLERSLQTHAAIAKQLGPYKLSLHSGSDKLSIYPLLARTTGGLFHVKTAGTSYLEALRVVAKHDPAAFREIIRFARSRYETDKATYHVSATLPSTPVPDDDVSDHVLESEYLECWDDVPPGCGFTKPGRQILHCTFGSVLRDPQWSVVVKDILRAHPETYTSILDDHFGRHLMALRG